MAAPSLWLDAPYAPRPPPRGALACDVAVVGAGMTGAMLARALAGQGLRVALLDAAQAAARASGRNGGIVASTLAEGYASVAQKRGRAVARDIWALNEANRERVAGLAARLREEGWDCGFARTGSWGCAATPAEAATLAESARMLREDGFDFAWLEPDEAVAQVGSPGRLGALHRPGDATLHPARFVRGLVAAAERQGVLCFENAPVRALARPARRGLPWGLAGEGFRVEAPQVALATNVQSAALHPWFAGRLRPVRGQMLATAPLAGAVKVPGVVYADEGYDYWRLHEGRLVLGGRRPVARSDEVGMDETVHPRVQAALDAFVRDHFPGAAARITHRWAGIMDFSLDGYPLIGEVPGEEGLCTAVGFTGHGFGWAPLAADALASRLLGRGGEVPGFLRADRVLDPSLGPP